VEVSSSSSRGNGPARRRPQETAPSPPVGRTVAAEPATAGRNLSNRTERPGGRDLFEATLECGGFVFITANLDQSDHESGTDPDCKNGNVKLTAPLLIFTREL